jgi:hypothetical protein
MNSDAAIEMRDMGWRREVMWRRDDGGIEHVRVTGGAGSEPITVDGVVAWPDAGDVWPDGGGDEPAVRAAHRVRYELRCDSCWRVSEVRVDAPDDGTSLVLHADGEGRWRDAGGAALAHLDGCIDVDLYAVAFTNTLPVRRLGVAVGESQTIEVAFVLLPSMEVQRSAQRYTRVSDNLYRYEGLASGFTADLQLDADGLVVTYPGLVRRMWAR